MHVFYIIYPHPFIGIPIVNIYQVIHIETTFYRPTFIVKPIPIINIPIFIIQCSFAFFVQRNLVNVVLKENMQIVSFNNLAS